MTNSADGRGRTLFDIIMGRNKHDPTPLELKYPNPLGAKVGCTVSFQHDPEISGINFVIDKIAIYETNIGSETFTHTDYHLRGVTLSSNEPYRFRLRLIPDADETNTLGCKVQLLKLYDEMEWDQEFHDNVLCNEAKEIDINYDDQGEALAEPNRYWRVEDILSPYEAHVTLLADKDGDGEVEKHELDKYHVQYWDYHRETDDVNGQSFTEFLTIEMNVKSHYFTFLRGKDIDAFQITVI